MDVTDDRDRRLDVDDIALLHQQLLGLGAYCLDDGIGQEFFAVEPSDAFIEVYASYYTVSESEYRFNLGGAYQADQALLMGMFGSFASGRCLL